MQKGPEKFIQKYYLPEAEVFMARIGSCAVLQLTITETVDQTVVAIGVLRVRGSSMASQLGEQAFSSCICVCIHALCFDQAAYLLVVPPTALPQQWGNLRHVKMAFIVSSVYELFCIKFFQIFQSTLQYTTTSTKKLALIKLDLLQSWGTRHFSLINFNYQYI